MRRRNFLLIPLIASVAAVRSAAQAAWPVRVCRFVVPFAAGSALDIPARMIAQRLGSEWGISFVVENRTGAGGWNGAQAVMQAPADGSTLLFTSASVSILPVLQPKLGFDPRKDLLPISLVCDVASVLLVRAASRFTSLPQLMADARSAPGRITYGSGGTGSSNHLAGALFASMAGIELLHVPYRGTAQSLNALYAGEIDLIFAPTLDVLGHVQQGDVRPLATTLPDRLPAMATVPAIAEFVPGYDLSNWFAIFAPARFPEDLRARLVQALTSLRDWPDLQARLAAGAALMRLDGPDPLAKRLADEISRWTRLVAKLGIKTE
ncbi:MAG TPA: tripartite tricarboxylate transporter substrate-binding protein [Candidatus Sulfotelmatobacter sp.]|nr:tripartite tricarboxylate transporter substrate-binding protein [Candidatus Sulfotelmatobacter sp.]